MVKVTVRIMVRIGVRDQKSVATLDIIINNNNRDSG